MKEIARKLVLFLFLILLPNICFAQQSEIIPQISIQKYELDSLLISDLFFANNYDLSFKHNKDIAVNYDKYSNMLYLQTKSFEGITTISFTNGIDDYVIPLRVKNIPRHKFTLTLNDTTSEVYLFGNFNNWNRSEFKLERVRGTKTYSIEIPLGEGVYKYKYFISGKEILDTNNPLKIKNGLGGENSQLIIPKSKNQIYLHILNYNIDSSFITINYFIERNKILNNRKAKVLALVNNHLLDKNLIKQVNNILSIKVPYSLFKNNLTIRTQVQIGKTISNIQTSMFNGIKPVGNGKFDWYDGILYSLMVDRFNNGDKTNDAPLKNDSVFTKANYMGGDLQGVLDKIEEGYFDSLNVNVIWLSPVYDNPDIAYQEYPKPHRWYSGYHGYWPISPTKVETKFGNLQLLKNVITEAHKHNIKILLDFVSNHVHKEHPYYKNHPDWFGNLKLPDGTLNLRFWDKYRLTTWFEPYLPSFDYIKSKDAVKAMTDNALWWLKETKADGFRHDAVKHVPYIFWRTLTAKIKKELLPKRDLYIYQIGETFGSYDLTSSYVNNGQLDAQFNFNLYDVAQKVFLDSNATFDLLDKEIQKSIDVYGITNKMGNIMDSHDKSRYMAFTDGDLKLGEPNAIEIGWKNPPKVNHPESYLKSELYLTYLFTIPGLPVIYYGSEFGMTGAGDPDNRRMMRFGNFLNKYEKKMLKEVRKITNLRKTHSALRYGDFYTIKKSKDIYVYVRSDLNERLLVVLNKSDKRKTIELKLPKIYGIKNVSELKSNKKIKIINDKLKITIPKYTGEVFQLNK